MASASSGSTSFEDSPASTAPSSTSSETETGAVAAVHAPEKSPDDTSKLRMFLGILKK